MILHHINLPGLTKYPHAVALQSRIVRRFLDYNKARMKQSNDSIQPPNPTLITFQTPPTYTCGRREIGLLSPSQVSYLENGGKAEYHEAHRGGLTTFHGPGQLTAFLICALRDHKFRPRDYIHKLETMTIETCSCYGVNAFTTENPGVWTSPTEKIASVGVRLQSGVSSYGIGLNVSVDLQWFDRIVACGLEGKRATSLQQVWDRERAFEDVVSTFTDFVAKLLPGVNGRIESVEP